MCVFTMPKIIAAAAHDDDVVSTAIAILDSLFLNNNRKCASVFSQVAPSHRPAF